MNQAASIAKVHRTTVWKWIKNNAIPVFRTPGGQIRLRRKDIVTPRPQPV